MKSKGLRTDPWCTPTPTPNSLLYWPLTQTRLLTSVYMPWMTRTAHSSTPKLLKAHQRTPFPEIMDAHLACIIFTLCVPVDSSFWCYTIHLGWSIVYIQWSQVIIAKRSKIDYVLANSTDLAFLLFAKDTHLGVPSPQRFIQQYCPFTIRFKIPMVYIRKACL